ncbi:MAG: barstar family protein [Clostridia bacterium]|nr:barstar family protein [Clostridia bacterium]
MYQYKEKYIIDFTEVQHYLEMHNIIRQALDWPDYYGCNWDAFWDCLTDMIGRPIHIEIIGLEVIQRKFGDTADKMLEILKEFKHCDNNEYTEEIKIDIVLGNNTIRLN